MRWILPVALVLLACEGPTGPLGPEGPGGESGPGTRVVFAGVSEGRQVDVRLPAGLSADDPPLFGCYRVEGGTDLVTMGAACAITTEAASGDPIIRSTATSAPWEYRIVVVF